MMGARNENSVLFSLDSLRLLDSGRVEEAPVSRLAVQVPQVDDGSGLIDVRALDAMMQDERPRAKAPRFSELTAPPVAIAPRPAPVRSPTTVAPPPTPLYMMLGMAALGLMGLAGYLVTQPPAPASTVVIERHIQAAAAAPEAVEEPEPEPEPEAVVAAVAAEPEPEAAPEPAKSPRKPTAKKPQPAASEKPQPIKPPTPAVATGPAPDSVECLLSRDGCKPKSAAPPPAVEQPPAVSSSSLPEKLEPGDIADGTRAAKAAALDRCRSHARGGEKVTIKLSIAGPEGSVLSSAPQDDAGNPALANCCAAELMRSSFKKVAKPQIGAVATLKF